MKDLPEKKKKQQLTTLVPIEEVDHSIVYGEWTLTQLMRLPAFRDSSPINKGIWIELYSYILSCDLAILAQHKVSFGTIINGANLMTEDWKAICPSIGLQQIRTNSFLWNFFNFDSDGYPRDIIIWGTPAWGELITHYEQQQ
jgi:hypothetical protein